jgi:hypothetical protein
MTYKCSVPRLVSPPWCSVWLNKDRLNLILIIIWRQHKGHSRVKCSSSSIELLVQYRTNVKNYLQTDTCLQLKKNNYSIFIPIVAIWLWGLRNNYLFYNLLQFLTFVLYCTSNCSINRTQLLPGCWSIYKKNLCVLVQCISTNWLANLCI